MKKNIFFLPENLAAIGGETKDFHLPSEPLEEQPIEEENTRPSMRIFLLMILFFIGVLAVRLWFLQISEGAKNLYLAEGNRIRLKNIPAPRGIIYDSENQPLVTNGNQSNLTLYPLELPKEENERQKIFDFLSAELRLDIKALQDEIKKKEQDFAPIILKENLSHEEALGLEMKIQDLPGLDIEYLPLRQYAEMPGLGHILGYTGKISADELKQMKDAAINSLVGKSGLEKIYHDWLKGKDGQEEIEVNSQGVFQRLIARQPPVMGAGLKLSLNSQLQKKATESLKRTLEQSQTNAGVAIGVNPQTGKILFMVSLPDFNPNVFNQGKSEVEKLFSDENRPLLNRAIGGQYPSGSSIKPVIAAAALQEKVVSADYKIDTPPEIRIGDSVFPDWKDHGLTDIRRALAESNNIFFYALGGGWDKIRGLGINRLDDYLKKFGFGEATKVDLVGETKGLVPTPEWKKKIKHESWYVGDTYHLAIGQGDLLVTPLQLLMAVSAIANNGVLFEPRVADEIVFDDGNVLKVEAAVKNKNFIAPENLAIVREGMRMAVTEGSARALNNIRDKNNQIVEVAGKTGTAQVTSDSFHAWTIAFAPYENPKIAVLVLVERGGEGYMVATPVVKEILEDYFTDRLDTK